MKSEVINDQLEYIQALSASYMAYRLLQDEEWHEYQLKMMQHNDIPGLVPMTYSVMDGKKSFRYNLTGLVSMDLYLSRKEPHSKELAQYLLQIMDCLTVAETYLLDFTHFVLEVAHTYIDLSTVRIYMVYVPIKYEEKEPFEVINGYLQDVLYTYRGEMSPALSVMINQLNARLRESYRSLDDLKKVLWAILNDEQTSQQPHSEVPHEVVEHASLGQHKYPPQYSPSAAEKIKSESYINRQKSTGLSKKSLVFIGLIVMNLIILGMVILFWSTLLGMTGGLINSVLGVVMICVPLNYFSMKGFGLLLKSDATSEKAELNRMQENKASKNPQTVNGKTPRHNKPEKGVAIHKKQTPKSSERISISDKREEVKARRIGVERDEFVIQQPVVEPHFPSARPTVSPKTELLSERQTYQAYLQDRDSMMTVPIADDRFIIGRQNDLVDLCVNEPTVGRIHAEIRREDDAYSIVDLNSKNGTRVNNDRIVSNMPIVLKEGDCIVFSTKAFYFRKGKN